MKDIDISVLRRCRELMDRHGADGMFPRGSQHKQFLRMEKEGLLRYVGMGVDIDAESIDREHHVYELTPAGRARLEELDADQYKAPPATDVLKSPVG